MINNFPLNNMILIKDALISNNYSQTRFINTISRYEFFPFHTFKNQYFVAIVQPLQNKQFLQEILNLPQRDL